MWESGWPRLGKQSRGSGGCFPFWSTDRIFKTATVSRLGMLLPIGLRRLARMFRVDRLPALQVRKGSCHWPRAQTVFFEPELGSWHVSLSTRRPAAIETAATSKGNARKRRRRRKRRGRRRGRGRGRRDYFRESD